MTDEELDARLEKHNCDSACEPDCFVDGLLAEVKRLRIELWARISPYSNTHSSSCPSDCRRPEHFPTCDPSDRTE